MGVSEQAQLWGGETTKAVANFPVSGERVPVSVVRWLGRIKGAAARANADLGLLDAALADRIAAAADEIAQGRHDDQFPIDVFQTGSGTSTNMNANEVIATLAGEGAHPNDHVNMGQSSNDVFPSAVHLAALDEAANRLLPALERLERAFAEKAEAFKDIVKSGRTHLMDAVPVTLGQEFSGYAAQIRLGRARVADALPRVAQIPLGGTATGTGLNTHPEFAAKVRERVAAATGLRLSAPAHPFEAQGARDALVELSGALKTVAVSEPSSRSSAGSSTFCAASSTATWTALGNRSLDDCPRLTSSLAWTSSPARVAITSLTFMLVEVPEPVWNTSMGNWSSCWPAAMASAAAAMRSARSASSSPSSALILAASALRRASMWITSDGTRSPEIGKFRMAFSVSPFHNCVIVHPSASSSRACYDRRPAAAAGRAAAGTPPAQPVFCRPAATPLTVSRTSSATRAARSGSATPARSSSRKRTWMSDSAST